MSSTECVFIDVFSFHTLIDSDIIIYHILDMMKQRDEDANSRILNIDYIMSPAVWFCEDCFSAVTGLRTSEINSSWRLGMIHRVLWEITEQVFFFFFFFFFSEQVFL